MFARTIVGITAFQILLGNPLLAEANFTLLPAAILVDSNAPNRTQISILEANSTALYNPEPTVLVAQVQVKGTLGCAQPEVLLDGSGSAKGKGILYHWLDENGQTIADENSYYLLVNRPGVYTLVVTDKASGQTLLSEAKVGGHAALGFKVKDRQNVQRFGESTGTFALEIVGGVEPFQVQWSNGATGLSQTGLAAGNYSLTVTDAEGCTGVVNTKILQPAPPKDAEQHRAPSLQIKVVADPKLESQNVVMDVSSPREQTLAVHTFNQDGQEVFSDTLKVSAGVSRHIVSTTHLPVGNYYVKVLTSEHETVIVHKWIKM